MKPEESREFTERLRKAALSLLQLQIFRKPDDLARRFDLPLPVVRFWWRNSDQKITAIVQNGLMPKQAKLIRRANQILEGWGKIKRYRPECGIPLVNGRKCKLSVAIRQPEKWLQGCLADRCRRHGGLAQGVYEEKSDNDKI